MQPGTVRDRQLAASLAECQLRRHSASPEHGHFAGANGHRVAEVGPRQVGDAQRRGSPTCSGAPCMVGKRPVIAITRSTASARIGPHADHQFAARSGRPAGTATMVRYIGTLRPSSICRTAQARSAVRAFSNVNEQPKQKAHQVVAPQVANVGRFVDVGDRRGERRDNAARRCASRRPARVRAARDRPARFAPAAGRAGRLSRQNSAKSAASAAGRMTRFACTNPRASPAVGPRPAGPRESPRAARRRSRTTRVLARGASWLGRFASLVDEAFAFAFDARQAAQRHRAHFDLQAQPQPQFAGHAIGIVQTVFDLDDQLVHLAAVCGPSCDIRPPPESCAGSARSSWEKHSRRE